MDELCGRLEQVITSQQGPVGVSPGATPDCGCGSPGGRTSWGCVTWGVSLVGLSRFLRALTLAPGRWWQNGVPLQDTPWGSQDCPEGSPGHPSERDSARQQSLCAGGTRSLPAAAMSSPSYRAASTIILIAPRFLLKFKTMPSPAVPGRGQQGSPGCRQDVSQPRCSLEEGLE